MPWLWLSPYEPLQSFGVVLGWLSLAFRCQVVASILERCGKVLRRTDDSRYEAWDAGIYRNALRRLIAQGHIEGD